MPDFANGARSIFEGLTFNNAAELEAAVRAAAAQRGLSVAEFLRNYRDNKTQIEGDYSKWSEANPGPSLAGEFAGALAPGIVGAFVPGGQGATAATAARAAPLVARVGRAMAEPLTMAAERYLPSLAAKRGMPTALGLADELGTGIVQSVGAADTMEDAPDRIVSDLPENLGFSLAVRGGNIALPPVVRAGKKGAKAARRKLSVKPPAALRAPQRRSMLQNYTGALSRLFGV